MTDPHADFDAEKLFARKEHHCGYRFCPFCAEPLVERQLDGHNRLVCEQPSCGYIYYQNPVPAAGVIIVLHNRILLVKRAHPPRVGWWCIPAGFMEWREHPTQTAVRELKEETGLHVTLTDFFEVYVGQDDPRTNAVLMLYLGEIKGGELRAGDDAMEVRFFGFDELPTDIAFSSHRQALKDYQERILGQSGGRQQT
jgi:ADP-ribose pyrophosphatase YjhB (NUDIX family)